MGGRGSGGFECWVWGFGFLFGLEGVWNTGSSLAPGSIIVFGTAQEQIVNYLIIVHSDIFVVVAN